jgi:hypothetical protein
MSFLEIFQPGLKHLHEERDRQRMLVVRTSHGGGPPLGIDLDAGTASIVVPGRAQDVDENTDPGRAEAETSPGSNRYVAPT